MHYKKPSFSLFLALVLILVCGCSETTMNRLKQVGKEPAIQATEMPNEKEGYRPVSWPEEEEVPVTNSSSLWQQGNRSFFKDRRARRVGDILRVNVRISDKAELDNKTTRERSTSEDLASPNVFGVENKIASWLPGTADPTNFLDISGKNKAEGNGVIEREEVIETEVAAMVTQILPNGNLVVHGDQEIRVNYEVRKITVSGIIRPEDIGADNSVESSKIAEARISYGGRGQLTDVQQPRVGMQLIDILSPF